MQTADKKFGFTQFVKNIVSNFLIFGIHTLIGFWYTPYLVNSLGRELFGFIPLANTVSSYFQFVTNSVNRSTGRYLTIALEKGEEKEANQIFNSSFFVSIVLIIALVPLGILLVYFAPALFNTPPGSENEVRYIFIGTILAFFLSTILGNLSVVPYSQNRLDLNNLIRLAGRIGQVAVVLLLFRYYSPRLAFAAAGVVALPLIQLLGNTVAWRKMLPQLVLRLKHIQRSLLKTMMRTSFWMIIVALGGLFITNMEMLVANKMLSLEQAGMYGALFTFPNNLIFIASSISGVWGPTILAKSASADSKDLDNHIQLAIKLTGLVVALPVGYIVGLGRQILSVWLGPDFEVMSWVLAIMVFHLSTNLVHPPLYTALVSKDKLKVPALVTLGLGLFSVVLMFLAAKLFGAVGIVSAAAIMLTLKNSIFTPIYVARVFGFPWWHYLIKITKISFVTLLTAVFSYVVGRFLPVNSLWMILLSGLLVSGVYALVVYQWGFSHKERGYVRQLFKLWRN